MANLKCREVTILIFACSLASCDVSTSVKQQDFVGTYVAKSNCFIDTLIIQHDFGFYHSYFEYGTQFRFAQKGEWKETVDGYYELVGWRADSASFKGADIHPKKDWFTNTVRFSYPLVTDNDGEYVKIRMR